MLVVVVHSCGSGNRKGGAGGVAAVLVRECYSGQGVSYTLRSAWIELICCLMVTSPRLDLWR